MFPAPQIASLLAELGFTHVVSVPDSTLGPWESAIAAHPQLTLIRACREGETWPIAAGLWLGGKMPLVMIQCTGLFESGDALRNILFDYQLPLFSIIGYRSYLNESQYQFDTARVFTEPILKAWGIDYRLIADASQFDEIRNHYLTCKTLGKPGCILIAEGKM